MKENKKKATINLMRKIGYTTNKIDTLTMNISDNILQDELIQNEYEILNLVESIFVSLSKNIDEYESEITDNLLIKQTGEDNSEYKCSGKMKYKFESTENGYRAILPPLLSRRSARYKSFSVRSRYNYYIFEKLLKDFQTSNPLYSRLSNATIVIISHTASKGKIIRDNDNVDAHDVINLINKYLLSSDDNGLRVSLVYDTMLSDDESYSEVFVLPKVNFLTLFGCQKMGNEIDKMGNENK